MASTTATLSLLLLLTAAAATSFAARTPNRPPFFRPGKDMNYFSLSEDVAPSSSLPVYTLEAEDPEGANVTFSFYDSENNLSQETEFFRVDPVSGQVFLLKKLDLDVSSSSSSSYNHRLLLPLTVSDGERSSNVLSNVEILEVNDEAPFFVLSGGDDDSSSSTSTTSSTETIQIPEDSVVGTRLLRIVVKDVDASNSVVNVRCKPLPTSPDACLKFNVRSTDTSARSWIGNLVLVGQLDFESTSKYSFLLEATDGINFSELTVHTEVLNIQDTPPIAKSLNIAIHEEMPVGSVVGRVEAKDGDFDPKPFHGLKYEIVKDGDKEAVSDASSSLADLFTIDESSGILKTANLVDRERLPADVETITLQVRVSEISNGVVLNGDESVSIVQVKILILDINDNVPIIQPAFKEITLKKSEIAAGINRPIVTDMTVVDSDAGDNSEFVVVIQEQGEDASAAAAFKVYPDDARREAANVRIYLFSHHLEKSEFTLYVVASETQSAEKLSTTATVVVKIEDDLAASFNDIVKSASSSSGSSASSEGNFQNSDEGDNDIVVTFSETTVTSTARPVSMIVVGMAVVCGVLLVITVVTGVVLLRKKPAKEDDEDEDDFEAGGRGQREAFQRFGGETSSSTLPHDTASTVMSELDPEDKEVYGIYKMQQQQQHMMRHKLVNVELGSTDNLSSGFLGHQQQQQQIYQHRQQQPDIYQSIRHHHQPQQHFRHSQLTITSDSALLPSTPMSPISPISPNGTFFPASPIASPTISSPINAPATIIPTTTMTRSELDLLQTYANRAFNPASPSHANDNNNFVDSSSFSDSTSSDAETVVAPVVATFRRPQQAQIKPVVNKKVATVVRGAGRTAATALRPEQLYEEMQPRNAAVVPDIVDSCCIDLEEAEDIEVVKSNNNNNNNDNKSNVFSKSHAFVRVQPGRVSSFQGDGVVF